MCVLIYTTASYSDYFTMNSDQTLLWSSLVMVHSESCIDPDKEIL